MLLDVALFLAGLVILVVGAESLIRGSVRVARALGVSPFVIGFTVIGFGTSLPELVVSISAAMAGSPEIAAGNVVGSNIANVGLVLGLAAVVRPLMAKMRLLKVEMPLVILASLLMWGLAADGSIDRVDGIIFLVCFLGLAIYMFRTAKEEPQEVKEELEHVLKNKISIWVALAMVVIGIGALLFGAHLMVTGAVAIARAAGVSEWLIGLTVVAVGTSLPEIAACVAAAVRGEADIALGNVAGSNLFNILLILGTTAVVCPLPISDSAIRAEIPVMVGFSLLLLVFVATGLRIPRWEGVLLVIAYIGFIVWQVVAE